MKIFNLYLDTSFLNDGVGVIETYDETETAIDNRQEIINTTSLASLTFDLITCGYQIFVIRNKKVVEFKPGMDNSHNKDIRFAHNIMKLIRAKVFDEEWE